MPEKTSHRRKVPISYIILERYEGPTSETDKPVTVKSFEEADHILYRWSSSAPKGGAYDKVGFTIVWKDGQVYKGRYDLKHHSIEYPNLSKYLNNALTFLTEKTKYKKEAQSILEHYQLK